MVGWRICLAKQAEQDITDILAWAAEQFSPQQAAVYAETLALALEALVEGPDATGARCRDDILPGIHVLHVARQGRRGRHFVVFRVSGEHCIDVLRIPHDSMDLGWHVQP